MERFFIVSFKTFFVLIFAFVLFSGFSAPLHAEDCRLLPVLVYHHIEPEPSSDVSCSPEQFEFQIKSIISAGYTPLNLEQVAKFLAGILDDKIEKPVVITFDDGYESLYEYALPVAEECKTTMIAFLITSRLGKKLQFAHYLSEKQIREMAGSGWWEFGSHTHDLHTDLMRIINAFGSVKQNPVIRLLKRDLDVSVTKLKQLTGKKPVAIAWPYGKFNSDTTAVARMAGLKLHFTSCYGYNEPGANPFAIKRIPVSSRDTAVSVLKKLNRFE
ncbi:MAG: polysaccharide deacetylase family protein [Candidatus Rifleibacteriota bacterium]